MLHAQLLGFGHPKTDERVHAVSPPPADFAAVLDELRRGINIGKRSPAFPVTPPCVRVRTRRFGWSRRYTGEQIRKSE
jgi:hypothetical protein